MAKKKIYGIAAVANNLVIGNGPDIPWRIKGDLARFKKITMGQTLVMGRKTFESIGKPLPGRETIIITRDRNYKAEGAIVVHDIEEAINAASNDIYVAGGGQIYKSMMPLCQKLYLTWVNLAPPGDILFPAIDIKNDWHEEYSECVYSEGKKSHRYSNLVRK